jgi:hypothetical protein
MPSMTVATALLGVDFSSAPTRRKPITVAQGRRDGAAVRLLALEALPTLAGFEALLARSGPWFGAFDFPFGLPREFVDALALGADTASVIAELRRRCPDRMAWRALVDAWGNGRPPGRRLIHRATDTAHPANSSSPLQTRYVPVGFMYYEGLARLVAAGVSLPGLLAGDPARVAVEGYPGRLAFELIGRRSYKNDPSPERLIARKDLLEALEQGRGPLGLRLRLSHAQRDALADDASGDLLDALLCLMQAAWAERQPGHGVPADVDAVEGWIVGPCPAVSPVSSLATSR